MKKHESPIAYQTMRVLPRIRGPQPARTAGPLQSETGAALITTLLVMTMLALVGVWSTQTSVLETRIAANDKLHKEAFYKASGGAEAGIELVEQNIEERGFPVVDESGKQSCTRGGIRIDLDHSSPTFYANADIGSAKPSCTNRDAFIPQEKQDCSAPLTNLRIGGNTTLSNGGAIQMIAGYEGKGKGAAGGGGWITYDIRSQHMGADNSESVINLRWKHVL